MFMISLSSFFTGPSTGIGSSTPRVHCGGTAYQRTDTPPAPNSPGRSAVRRRGDVVSAYREIGLSAVTADMRMCRARLLGEGWFVRKNPLVRQLSRGTVLCCAPGARGE